MSAVDLQASERRSAARREVAVAATLERADGEQRLSLVCDISETGARLLVASRKVAVGDKVYLSLLFSDGASTAVDARLLRVQLAQCAGPWKTEIAVRFGGRVRLSGHALS
jgi:hypothetical protein